MKEDDENPYANTNMDVVRTQENVYDAWNEGDEHGQLHPSPQTIKKIQSEAVDNFAEKVKPLVDQLDYELGSYHEAVERMQMPAIHPPTWSVKTLSKIKDIIDNTLKEKEGEE